MSSTSDFLFQGSTPASFTSTTTNDPNMPPWWQSAVQALITQGSSIAGQPYNPSPFPSVAPLDPLQQQAMDEAPNITQPNQDIINQGASNIQNVENNPFNQQAYNDFLAPELTGANSEISSLQNLATQNLTENILPSVNNGLIGNGIFGTASANGIDSPTTVQDQRAIQNANTSLLQSEGGVLNNAYNSAATAAQNANSQAIQGGAAQGSLGATGEQVGLQGVGALSALGSIGQNQVQNNFNAANNSFQAQNQYPLQMLDMLSGLIHGYQPTVGSTSYSTGAQPSGVPQVGATSGATGALGALTSLASI